MCCRFLCVADATTVERPHTRSTSVNTYISPLYLWPLIFFFNGYCSTVQGLLDWFEVDLGFTELSFPTSAPVAALDSVTKEPIFALNSVLKELQCRVCCSVLQCERECCSVCQCFLRERECALVFPRERALCKRDGMRKKHRDTATHCNTLQHTATDCNRLQQTATDCNRLQHRQRCHTWLVHA